MKRQTLLYILAVLVVVAVVVFAGPAIVAAISSTPTPTPQPGIANPASVYCTERGYQLELRNGPNGVVGVCIFPDKSECEEWAFFRGECGTKWATPTR